VDAVAIGADSDLRVPFLKQQPVATRPILVQLVDPEAGVEGLDVGGIRMAAGAERGDLRALRGAPEGFVLRQILIVLGRVTSVAVRAAQAELLVDIQLEALDGGLELVLELAVAFETAVFLGQERPREEERADHHRRGESEFWHLDRSPSLYKPGSV
jgi:hypothetical protein